MGVWQEFQAEYDGFLNFVRKNRETAYSDWKENITNYYNITDFIQMLYEKQSVVLSGNDFVENVLFDDVRRFNELNEIIGMKLYQYYIEYIKSNFDKAALDVFVKWVNDVRDFYNFDDFKMTKYIWGVDILNQFEFVDESRIKQISNEINDKLYLLDDDTFLDWILQTRIKYTGKPVNFKDIMFDLSYSLLPSEDIIFKGLLMTTIDRMLDDDELGYTSDYIEEFVSKYRENLLFKFKEII